MTTTSDLNIHDAIRGGLLMDLHQRRFRNGSFVNEITRDTPLVDALNTLYSSPLLSSTEKENVKTCRDEYIAYRDRSHGNPKVSHEDIQRFKGPMAKLMEMFHKDATARGLYVPPMLTQTMNANGSVRETTIVNYDGTETLIEGDVHSVFHGAPEGFTEEFAAMQAANSKLFTNANNGKDFLSGWMETSSVTTYSAPATLAD